MRAVSSSSGLNGTADLLSCYRHWFVERAFSVVPNVFYQIFTMRVLANDAIVPCLYGLISIKTEQKHERFWAGVYSFIQNLQHESNLTDFEMAGRLFENISGLCFYLDQSM